MTASFDRRLNAVRPDLADRRLQGQVEAPSFVEGRAAQVARPLSGLRRRPSSEAPLDTEALFGERVTVFEATAEGWSWVQLDRDRYVGWMGSEALTTPGMAPTHEVAVPRTLVFPGPDIKLPPLFALPMGALVAGRTTARDHNAEYRLIEPFGAIVVQHLREIGELAADPVAIAERFVGTPYLWGGKSWLGIDCSGLVQLAWAMAGIAVPRDSDMQEAWAGESLPAGAPLQRGDLVFWRGHVGIMLDGTRLLHANAHHMATAIEPLAEAEARLEAKGAPVTAIKRPAARLQPS